MGLTEPEKCVICGWGKRSIASVMGHCEACHLALVRFLTLRMTGLRVRRVYGNGVRY